MFWRFVLENLNLFGLLHEAASAKAGIWNLLMKASS